MNRRRRLDLKTQTTAVANARNPLRLLVCIVSAMTTDWQGCKCASGRENTHHHAAGACSMALRQSLLQALPQLPLPAQPWRRRPRPTLLHPPRPTLQPRQQPRPHQPQLGRQRLQPAPARLPLPERRMRPPTAEPPPPPPAPFPWLVRPEGCELLSIRRRYTLTARGTHSTLHTIHQSQRVPANMHATGAACRCCTFETVELDATTMLEAADMGSDVDKRLPGRQRDARPGSVGLQAPAHAPPRSARTPTQGRPGCGSRPPGHSLFGHCSTWYMDHNWYGLKDCCEV